MLSIIRTSVSHTQGGSSILLPKKYTSSEIFRSIGYLTLRKSSKKNKISGVWNEFQAILIHFRSIYSIFLGGYPPRKKSQRLSTLFAIGGELRPSAQPRGGPANKKNLQWMFLRGGYYIFVIYNCFFLFLTQKCALYRMSNSPNLNCIFSGGGALAENKIPLCNFNWPKGGRLGHFSLPEQVF